jgi:hypothetical protein
MAVLDRVWNVQGLAGIYRAVAQMIPRSASLIFSVALILLRIGGRQLLLQILLRRCAGIYYLDMVLRFNTTVGALATVFGNIFRATIFACMLIR